MFIGDTIGNLVAKSTAPTSGTGAFLINSGATAISSVTLVASIGAPYKGTDVTTFVRFVSYSGDSAISFANTIGCSSGDLLFASALMFTASYSFYPEATLFSVTPFGRAGVTYHAWSRSTRVVGDNSSCTALVVARRVRELFNSHARICYTLAIPDSMAVGPVLATGINLPTSAFSTNSGNAYNFGFVQATKCSSGMDEIPFLDTTPLYPSVVSSPTRGVFFDPVRVDEAVDGRASSVRVKSGREFRYLWGVLTRVSAPFQRMPSSDGAYVNSLWAGAAIVQVADEKKIFAVWSGKIVNGPPASSYELVAGEGGNRFVSGTIDLESF